MVGISREFIMQSGNPALNKNTFLDAASGAVVAHGDQRILSIRWLFHTRRTTCRATPSRA
jgi:hypothetical protein